MGHKHCPYENLEERERESRLEILVGRSGLEEETDWARPGGVSRCSWPATGEGYRALEQEKENSQPPALLWIQRVQPQKQRKVVFLGEE